MEESFEEEENEYKYTSDDLIFLKNFTYRETVDHIFIKRYIGDSSEVIIPDTFKTKPITFLDKNLFSDCNNVEITSIKLGNNLISFPVTIRNIKTIKKVTLGKRINCVETLFKDSSVEEVDVGSNINYRFYDGCLISEDGKQVIWNKPNIKKLPERLESIGCACQFYDEIFIPSSIVSIHADSMKTKNMIIYYGGSDIEWKKVKIVRTLNARDLKKGIFDNEVHGKDLNQKFKRAKNRIKVEVKFAYIARPN